MEKTPNNHKNSACVHDTQRWSNKMLDKASPGGYGVFVAGGTRWRDPAPPGPEPRLPMTRKYHTAEALKSVAVADRDLNWFLDRTDLNGRMIIANKAPATARACYEICVADIATVEALGATAKEINEIIAVANICAHRIGIAKIATRKVVVVQTKADRREQVVCELRALNDGDLNSGGAFWTAERIARKAALLAELATLPAPAPKAPRVIGYVD